MIKKFKNQTIWVLLFIVMPMLTWSQIDPPPDGPDEIDPPPAAPIDDSIAVLWVIAVLFAAYFFYKRNFKIETK